MLRHPVEGHAQVLQVEDKQSALVGNAEHNVENAVLRLVQLEQATQQLRSHLADGGTHGMTLLAKHIIEADGTSLELRVPDTKFRQSFLDETAHFAHLRDAAEVALHIGHEAGYACLTEGFGHHLQRNRLTRTRGTSNQSMPVGHLTCNTECALGAMGNI